MSKDDVLEMLRGLRFLQNIELTDLDLIASVSHRVELPAGEYLFREGAGSSEIYVVHQGKVALEICAPGVGCRRIMTAGEGELLGWTPLLGGAALTATARTLTPVELVAIDAPALLALCEEHPRIGYDFMRRTAQALAFRLSATRMQLLDVFGSQMAEVAAPPLAPEGGS